MPRNFCWVVLLSAWLTPFAPVLAQTTPSPRFRDTQNFWAAACIDSIATEGLLRGYPDGRFAPSATLTRAEFAAVMVKAFPDAIAIRSAPNFSDVPANHWAKGAIAKAYEFGFLSGYPGNIFRPNQPISKAQALTILANSNIPRDLANPEAILQQTYNDASEIPSYARRAIASATVANIVVNYPNVRQLQPNRDLSRGEVAALLCQVKAQRTFTVSTVPEEYVVLAGRDGNSQPASARLLKEFPNQGFEGLLEQSAIAADKLFFAANDGRTGQELWVSDGTPAGTQLVRDLRPGLTVERIAKGSQPRFLGTSGSQVLLSTDSHEVPGDSLWISDGTTQGTVAIAPRHPALLPVLSSIERFVNGRFWPVLINPNINGRFRFPVVAMTENDIQIWQIAEGAAESETRLLKRFDYQLPSHQPVGLDFFPSASTASSEQFFFVATTTTEDLREVGELWRSDGTPEGTIALKTADNTSAPFRVRSDRMYSWQNRAYFLADRAAQGFEWWTSDGTPGGTVLLHSFAAAGEISGPRMLTGLGDSLFALANSPEGFELWVSEETSATTRRVKRLREQPSVRKVLYSSVYNNKLFFAISNNQSFERANDISELWMSDGTEQGTVRLAQFGQGSVSGFTVFKDRLFFGGNGADGHELWVSDGTAGGTKQLIDLSPGTTPCTATEDVFNPNANCPSSSVLSSFTVKGDWLYFILNNSDLYRTDGTAAGTQKVQHLGSTDVNHPARIVLWNQQLMLSGYDAERDRHQLWLLP